MRSRRLILWLYVIFLVTILAQSAWWFIYISREADHHAAFRMQRLATDRIHAAYLLRTSPELRHELDLMRENFPGLIFHETEQGVDFHVNPEAERSILADSKRRRRMFFWEGAFFLVVLMGGASVVYLAYRRENSYRRARELFLAGVTHEFKTPLASLGLYADTIARPELPEKERMRILGHMSEDLERLRLMVEQVLAVSREGAPGSLRPVSLDPAELVRQVIREMGALIGREGAVIEATLAEGLRVRADEGALISALRNLLSNAIHYSPAPARVSLAMTVQGARLHLSVADQGPGIARSEQKRIFQSFYRVGEAGRRPAGIHGSGLGLYLVKRNLEAMGGRVELESTPGAGATFTLILPLVAAEENPS